MASPLQRVSSPRGELGELDAGESKPSLFGEFATKANTYHSRMPYVRKLPLPVIGIILTLVLVNIIVWAAVGVILVSTAIWGLYSA